MEEEEEEKEEEEEEEEEEEDYYCSLYSDRLDLVSGLRPFGGGARAPFPNSGW